MYGLWRQVLEKSSCNDKMKRKKVVEGMGEVMGGALLETNARKIKNEGRSPSLFTMSFMIPFMRVSINWYSAESFSIQSILPWCRILTLVWEGSKQKRSKKEKR